MAMAPPRSTSRETRASDPRRALGRRGEQLAAEHLRRRGYSVVERNVRTRHGEIDLVVRDRHALVFVEVKTRSVPRRRAIGERDDPLQGLGLRQRRSIRRLAAAWLREQRHRRPHAETIRFDAIGVVVDADGAPRQIEHVQDAF
jgi:putative endonuclease